MMFLNFITNQFRQCEAEFKQMCQVYHKTITCDMFLFKICLIHI